MSTLTNHIQCSEKSLVIPVSGSPCGIHSRLKPQPLSKKVSYELIYSYTSVSQMASQTEILDVDITFIGATTFHQICIEAGVEPILLCPIHSKVSACSAKSQSSEPVKKTSKREVIRLLS